MPLSNFRITSELLPRLRRQKQSYRPWGSDGSAAGGGRSDLSEWPRSTADAAALAARKMSGTATGGAKRLRSATCLQVATLQPHGRQKKGQPCGCPGVVILLTLMLPQQQQPRKRSYRPWGCYQRPGSPSFPRGRGRRKSRRTEHHRAYDP